MLKVEIQFGLLYLPHFNQYQTPFLCAKLSKHHSGIDPGMHRKKRKENGVQINKLTLASSKDLEIWLEGNTVYGDNEAVSKFPEASSCIPYEIIFIVIENCSSIFFYISV